MKVFIFILALFCSVLLFACSDSKQGENVNPVVKINGTVYTTADLADFAAVMLWEVEPKDLESSVLGEQILNGFIEHRLLLEEAEKRNIHPTRESINQLYEALESQEGVKELKALTGRYNANSKKVAQLMTERLVINELFRVIVVSADVTDLELRKYYDSKHIASEPITGKAHILHIFSTDNDTIQKAAMELSAGILFEEVARKYSEGLEKNFGGNLGYISETEYPEFFEAAFKLKEGEVSRVISSEYGFHIFKMVQFAKASGNSYENVKQRLLAELYLQKRQIAVTEFVNALQSNANISYLRNISLSELKSHTY
jgi:parvulin-like peptidyl-prolyl isomerase